MSSAALVRLVVPLQNEIIPISENNYYLFNKIKFGHTDFRALWDKKMKITSKVENLNVKYIGILNKHQIWGVLRQSPHFLKMLRSILTTYFSFLQTHLVSFITLFHQTLRSNDIILTIQAKVDDLVKTILEDVPILFLHMIMS